MKCDLQSCLGRCDPRPQGTRAMRIARHKDSSVEGAGVVSSSCCHHCRHDCCHCRHCRHCCHCQNCRHCHCPCSSCCSCCSCSCLPPKNTDHNLFNTPIQTMCRAEPRTPDPGHQAPSRSALQLEPAWFAVGLQLGPLPQGGKEARAPPRLKGLLPPPKSRPGLRPRDRIR